jgi:hypothetical protein
MSPTSSPANAVCPVDSPHFALPADCGTSACWHSLTRAVLSGGLVSGVLDAINGVIAFYLALGLNPVQVLQFIASGALGDAAFDAGLPAAALGTFFHFLIAFVAAGVYVAIAARWSLLRTHWILAGLAYGIGVWAFMNLGVLPLSAVRPVPMTLPLVLNGIVGHALNVGLPIAYFARKVQGTCALQP